MSSKIVHHMEGLHGRQNDFMAFSSLSSVVEKAPPIVWIAPQASIAAACELLKAHHFLSLPIYDEGKRRILGLVDILDVCAYLCWGTMHFFSENTEAQSDRELKAKMSEVAIVEVLNAKPQHGRASLVVKRHLEPVCSLLDQMAQGLHRALVRVWPETEEEEDEGSQRLEYYRMAAQIDVVRFLVDHRRNLNYHLITSSITALDMVGPAAAAASTPSSQSTTQSAARTLIYSVEEGRTALEAFRTLALSGVHAIGIIGIGSTGQGRLLYNLSASDLRGITPDTVHLLREPVEVYLERLRESDPTSRPRNLVTCTPDATLIEVMELVLRSRVHRVWVTDQQQRPLGLITLTDILSKFASFDYARAQAAATKTIVPLSLSSPH